MSLDARNPPEFAAAAAGAARAVTDASAARVLPVEAVLFDLDGTLADTAPDLGAALNRVRHERGLDPVPLHTLRSASSHGARGLLRTGLGVLPEHPDYIALRDAFLAAGGRAFHYIPCLNDSTEWIGALGRIAEQHLSGWPTQAAPDAQALAAQRERALALGARE